MKKTDKEIAKIIAKSINHNVSEVIELEQQKVKLIKYRQVLIQQRDCDHVFISDKNDQVCFETCKKCGFIWVN